MCASLSLCGGVGGERAHNVRPYRWGVGGFAGGARWFRLVVGGAVFGGFFILIFAVEFAGFLW